MVRTVQRSSLRRNVIEREQARQQRCIICKEFLTESIKKMRVHDDVEHTCTSLTTSYSSTSAKRSIADLLNILLKSEASQHSRSTRMQGAYDSPTDTDSTLRTLAPAAQPPTPTSFLHCFVRSIHISCAACDLSDCYLFDP